MAQQTINAGTVANDGTGDPLRTAFGKVNANFGEVYGLVAANTAAITAEATARTSAGYLTSAALSGYATTSNVTTAISTAVAGLYSASNPAGYQTAAQVTTTLGSYLTTAAAASTYATPAQVTAAIQQVVGAAPSALDTLAEIAAQLASDESAVGALTTTVASKLSKAANLSDLASPATARTNLGLSAAAIADVVVPAAASQVPSLASMQILLADGTYLTGTQLQAALAGTAPAVPGQASIAAGSPTSSTIPYTITAPSSGGTPTGYTITYTPAGGSALTASVTSLTGTLTGLVASKAYTITVAATNAGGTGTASSSITATTLAASTPTITVATPAQQTAGTPFAVTGAYANGTPTALDYSLDGGTAWTAATSPTIGSGTYSISGVTVSAANASQTVRVRDHSAQSVVGVSATFAVIAAGGGAQKLKLIVYGGGAIANPTTGTLPQNYQGFSFGMIFSSPRYVDIAKASDGSLVSGSNVLIGAGTSSTTPPGAATDFGGPVNGMSAFTGNNPPSVKITQGSAPSPGAVYYVWMSDDNGATYSVATDSSNNPIVFRVIG